MVRVAPGTLPVLAVTVDHVVGPFGPLFGAHGDDEDVVLHGRAAAEVRLSEVEGPGARRRHVSVGRRRQRGERLDEKDDGHTKGGFEHGLSCEGDGILGWAKGRPTIRVVAYRGKAIQLFRTTARPFTSYRSVRLVYAWQRKINSVEVGSKWMRSR
jgi:hypothetical protein